MANGEIVTDFQPVGKPVGGIVTDFQPVEQISAPKIFVNAGLEEALATEKLQHYPEGKTWKDHMLEMGVQGPATSIKFLQGYAEGATLGLLKLPAPNTDAFLAERSALGEETTGGFAQWLGKFAGEFMPVSLSYKAGLGLLAKGGLPKSVVMREVGAGAYAGLIYGVARGIAEGKNIYEILAQGGWSTATWATMGAVVGKFSEWIGGAKTKEALGNVAIRLAHDIKISKEKAKDLVSRATRAVINPPTAVPGPPKWTPTGMPGTDVSGRPMGLWNLTGEYQPVRPGMPTGVPATGTATTRLGTFRRPAAEPSGWPGAGELQVSAPPFVRFPSEVTPKRIAPSDIIFVPPEPGQIAGQEVAKTVQEAVAGKALMIPKSALKKPGAAPGTVTEVTPSGKFVITKWEDVPMDANFFYKGRLFKKINESAGKLGKEGTGLTQDMFKGQKVAIKEPGAAPGTVTPSPVPKAAAKPVSPPKPLESIEALRKRLLSELEQHPEKYPNIAKGDIEGIIRDEISRRAFKPKAPSTLPFIEGLDTNIPVQKKILGKQYTKWRKAQKGLESSNDDIVERAQETIDDIEGNLDPEDIEKLYKVVSKAVIKPKPRPEHLMHPEPPAVGLKGLPVVELSEEEFKKEIRRSRMQGVIEAGKSVKDEIDDDIVSLHSGLPIDQIRPLMARLRKHLGKRTGTGDLSLVKVALSGILSPEELALAHPQTASFVLDAKVVKYATEKIFVNEFMRLKDKFIKHLGKSQQEQIAVLLHNYNRPQDVPIEISKKLEPVVLRAFGNVRRLLDMAWSKFVQNKVETLGLPLTERNLLSRLLIHYNNLEEIPPNIMQAAPKHILGLFENLRKTHAVPRKVSGYLTRIFSFTDDLDQGKAVMSVRNFAEEEGLDYMLALRLLEKRIPKQGQFGPLSKERVLEDVDIQDLVLNLNQILDFYGKGTGRKMFLDKILPAASSRLATLQEGTPLHNTMLHYIERLRGLPANVVEAAVQKRPWAVKILRAEALHQFISKIGVNPAAAFFNATQYPLMDGAKFLGAAMRERSTGPLADFGYGAAAVLFKRGRLAAHRAGMVFDVGKAEVPIWDVPGFWSKLGRITGAAFTGIERYNKTASYNANLHRLERTFKGVGTLTASEKYRLFQRGAIKGVGETQYFMGVESRPSVLAGPLGSTFGRFKIFPIKTLERIAHMDKYELLAFLGILDILGGPDAIPGLRQLRFELNQEFPDGLVTKTLNKLGWKEEVQEALNVAQDYSLAGATGIDIGAVTGLGFIPGGSLNTSWHRNYARRFWTTIGRELEGPTIGDFRNLALDIQSGEIDLDDVSVQELLALRSANTINVSVRRTARAIQEWQDKFIKYQRERPGPKLTDFEVIIRAWGFPSTSVNRQLQVTENFLELEQEAFREKFKLEDSILDLNEKLEVETNPAKREKLVDRLGATMVEMEAFNNKYIPRARVRITAATVREAAKNRELPFESRIAQGRLQQRLLQEQMERHLGEERR